MDSFAACNFIFITKSHGWECEVNTGKLLDPFIFQVLLLFLKLICKYVMSSQVSAVLEFCFDVFTGIQNRVEVQG